MKKALLLTLSLALLSTLGFSQTDKFWSVNNESRSNRRARRYKSVRHHRDGRSPAAGRPGRRHPQRDSGAVRDARGGDSPADLVDHVPGRRRRPGSHRR